MIRHRAVDGFLHGFAQDALAELLFQQRHRDFPLTEALHFHFGLRLGQLFVHFGVQLACGQRDLVAALEAFVQGLGDLHPMRPSITSTGHPPRGGQIRRSSMGHGGIVQANSGENGRLGDDFCANLRAGWRTIAGGGG